MVDASPYGLFVSSVEGQPVTRYGTRTLIGAARSHEDPRVIHYTPDLVVALTHQEWAMYRREYQRALKDGSLRRRSDTDWLAQQEQPKTAAPEAPTPESK